MRKFTILAFDDTISGTATTWYTPVSLADQLGSADGLQIQAITTDVSGTSPTLTCAVEHSGDGRNWMAVVATAEINATAIANETTLLADRTILYPPMLRFVRIKITLGGTTPKARLKLYVTGRVSGKANGAPAGAGARPRPMMRPAGGA